MAAGESSGVPAAVPPLDVTGKATSVEDTLDTEACWGCPIVKKRKLEEAEAEAEEIQAAPKKKTQTAKPAADGGFAADSDAAEEEEEQKEGDGEDEETRKTAAARRDKLPQQAAHRPPQKTLKQQPGRLMTPRGTASAHREKVKHPGST
ncbi:myelin transcription factor 1-like [Salarias fasciatus]|uniref:myelin transcription factor 1-like n=1 Tax=Salarias fasciatus TaxID=181472 RepID=UPI001177057C|nr:myelin transcription factor 1-like [Salarias fasciatus]